MDSHRRWFCRECKREWVEPRACYANSSPVSITGNPLNGPNCQVCGSPEIELVEYKPNYPGLDIPREQPNKVIESEIISVIPGQVTSNSYSIRNEPLLGRPADELIMPSLATPKERASVIDFTPNTLIPVENVNDLIINQGQNGPALDVSIKNESDYETVDGNDPKVMIFHDNFYKKMNEEDEKDSIYDLSDMD